MTFSTRSNPRLAASPVALTSLGAVGGARGTAAGALRIFVEFLTTYDSSAAKELESDLRSTEQLAKSAHTRSINRAKEIAKVQNQLAQVQSNLRNRADAATRKEIRLQDALQGTRTKAGKAALADSKERLTTLLQAQGFTEREITAINGRYTATKRLSTLRQQDERAQQRAIVLQKQQVQTEGQLSRIQQIRASFAPRLAGLAIGAVGGILGGAVLGVGFQLAQTAIEKVGDSLQDLIDPARHAREEVVGLAKAINDIADQKNITQLAAAQEFLKNAGVPTDTGTPGANLANLLAENAARQQALDIIGQYTQALDVQAHQQKLLDEALKTTSDAIRQEAKANGDYVYIAAHTVTGVDGPRVVAAQELSHGIDIQTLAQQRLNEVTANYVDVAAIAAAAAEAQARAAESAAALTAIAYQTLQNAIEQSLSQQTGAIDQKIANLPRDSKRTRRLERRAAAPQSSGGGADNQAKRQELENIAEQRALILLRMRLRLMGTNINLEKYSGKFLMEAINAKIAALQKEGEEQQRLNQLLDLQYQASQQIKRQAGESINDFVERRAQEQRHQLQERADLDRQSKIERLNNRKDVLQNQLDLEDLANQKRDALRRQDTASQSNNLQKQLAASRKADQKAYNDRKAALEKQKKLLEAAAHDAEELVSESSQAQTLAAIRGMRNLDDVSKFSGRLSGLLRAKGAIESLVEGFGLPKAIAAPFLAKINGMLEQASAKIDQVIGRLSGGPTSKQGFAKGGVFSMNNATNPFGTNVRTGEEGSEIGIVLSHKVAAILQKQRPGIGQVGPFYMNPGSNRLSDEYRMRKLVQEGVEAAFG